MDSRSIVYTADFGGYDNVYAGADVRYNEDNDPYGGNKQLSPKMRAKMYKILNPEYHALWIDSNIELLDKDGLLEAFGDCDMGLIKHPTRQNPYQELTTCKELGFIDQAGADRLYSNLHPGIDKELFMGGVLYRPEYNEEFNDGWWSLICQYSDRDQLTLPTMVRLFGGRITVLDINIYDNPYFKIHSHK